MEEEQDLEEILARIAEQEASEALARELEAEWNPPSTSSNIIGSQHVGDGNQQDVIVIEDTRFLEDDESMARRLAQEWGSESQAGPSYSSKSTHNSSATHRAQPLSMDDSSPQDVTLAPDTRLLKCKTLFTGLRGCPKCKEDMDAPRGQVIFSATVPPPSLLMLLHAVCHSCKASYCRGCLAPMACAPDCKGKNACLIKICCASARAVGIFETLGGLDRAYINERAAANHRANQATKLKRAANDSVGPGGTGYGTGGNYGDSGGYGSRSRSKKRKLNDGAAEMITQVSSWDRILVAAIITVTEFLPDPYSENAQTFDFLPNPCIGHLISLSYLPDILAGLLRNDSVTDWVDRKEVYNAVLALLRRMVDCELTVECLIRPRWEKLTSCGLEDWMWGDGQITWEMEKDMRGRSTSTVARSPPLYDSFNRLSKQCQAFIAGAQHLGDDADDALVEEMVEATSLCGDIIAARDDIERTIAALGITSATTSAVLPQDKGKSVDEGDLEKTYAMACERLAFQYTDTDIGFGPRYTQYNYAAVLSQTERMTRQPKDRLHFIKELAVMATCLPPGVWVRVDETRNDAIPEEEWTSKSSLLQVIVSIQGMIFVEAPYFNEYAIALAIMRSRD
ncbi:hypothetical protein HWV62_28686 [Athelia sp. TMB]|nr:hypothetical protein HWV62_28686 [Athelia sp. TMB]